MLCARFRVKGCIVQDSVCSVQGSWLNMQSAPEGGFGRLAARVLGLLLSDSNGPLLGGTVEQCKALYSSVQLCTEVYSSEHYCTLVNSSVQQCTTVYNSVQHCTEV